MLNLDTHMIVAVLSGDLTSREFKLVSTEPLALSSISLWELARLVQLKRLVLDMESAAFRQFLSHVLVFPITLEIALRSTQLDFRSDPADEIIAATSVVERVPLLTRDRKLLRSTIVPLARARR
jgi:PIN domain nuclease of toxin-antitoxin system